MLQVVINKKNIHPLKNKYKDEYKIKTYFKQLHDKIKIKEEKLFQITIKSKKIINFKNL